MFLSIYLYYYREVTTFKSFLGIFFWYLYPFILIKYLYYFFLIIFSLCITFLLWSLRRVLYYTSPTSLSPFPQNICITQGVLVYGFFVILVFWEGILLKQQSEFTLLKTMFNLLSPFLSNFFISSIVNYFLIGLVFYIIIRIFYAPINL